ncbi:MAG: protocatechuate 3,4-dioxygenase subunit alpha [Silicimonas sp.]|nr:protocatechuate 3,4-dioxygenase subunit alpha [Silicimonas sp.]
MPDHANTQKETPSQTAGPYVHIGCIPSVAGLDGPYAEDLGNRAVEDGAEGQRITITGRIVDGAGEPLLDAMIESWHCDAAGYYPGQPGADPAVKGFCRLAIDGNTGEFTLRTIKPGASGAQAPHIALWITARGINIGLQTRIYFEDEDNDTDPLLTQIRPPGRRQSLIATQTGDGTYRFDIHLQGARETVFLDI